MHWETKKICGTCLITISVLLWWSQRCVCSHGLRLAQVLCGQKRCSIVGRPDVDWPSVSHGKRAGRVAPGGLWVSSNVGLWGSSAGLRKQAGENLLSQDLQRNDFTGLTPVSSSPTDIRSFSVVNPPPNITFCLLPLIF